MYTPSAFKVANMNTLYAFIEQNSFAVVFSQYKGRAMAAHLPLLLDRSGNCLYGHMARANPQWRETEGEVLAVFHGPHAYISPSWYETDQAVPTWNYAAVHVTGEFTPVEDQQELLHILTRTVDTYESRMPAPWDMKQLEPELLRKLTAAIVGFRIDITNMEGKWKLSQNHSEHRRQRVIDALERQTGEDAGHIAALMRQYLQ